MKKYLFLILIIGVLVFFFSRNNKVEKINDAFKDYKIISYTLKNKKLNLLVADTREKWEKGLMYCTKLQGADGMIFLFPEKQYRSFWNKNTLMDLNVYWLSDDNVVREDELPSVEKTKQIITINSPEKINKVIEQPLR
jgi:uncharacterized membrane protein (UPF0127 family)